MTDYIFIIAYVFAAGFIAGGVVPAIAFSLTMLLTMFDMSGFALHAGFSVIYLMLIPLSNIRIAWGMLISAVVNLLAAAYYLSSLFLSNDVLYFAISMIMVNLYILSTVFKGVKNGAMAANSDLVINRVMDSCNLQRFTTAQKGR